MMQMGAYGLYIWPCYVVTGLALAGMLVQGFVARARARKL